MSRPSCLWPLCFQNKCPRNRDDLGIFSRMLPSRGQALPAGRSGRNPAADQSLLHPSQTARSFIKPGVTITSPVNDRELAITNWTGLNFVPIFSSVFSSNVMYCGRQTKIIIAIGDGTIFNFVSSPIP